MIDVSTDEIESSSSGSSDPPHRDRLLSREIHHARMHVAILSEEEVRAYARDRFDECMRWLTESGYHVTGTSFDEMHGELARDYGNRDRAMLYRTFLCHQMYDAFGADLQMPPSIGDVATVRGYIGSGGSGSVWYCDANVDALRDGVPAFVKEMLSVAGDRTEERERELTEILRHNIDELRDDIHRRVVTKLYRIPQAREEQGNTLPRAGREMRRMCIGPDKPLRSVLPRIVGGQLRDDARHFHVIHEGGVDLRTLLKVSGPLHWRTASDVCAQLSRILKLFEDAGMVHLDLKPGNIFMKENGDIGVLDLGTTKFAVHDTADLTQGVHGTFEYMAPERASPNKASLTSQADVYSMAHVMLSLLEAVAPAHFPDGYLDDRNTVETVTHRAVLLKEWAEKHHDSFRDVKKEWGQMIDIHFQQPGLTDEAKKDPRLARYLEAWKTFVWSMLHPIPSMRPSPTEVFRFFVSHSRFASAPNVFLRSGTVPHQDANHDRYQADPADAHPLLKKMNHDAIVESHLRSPWGHDLLDDFRHETTTRLRKRYGRRSIAIALASAAGIAGISALVVSRNPPPKHQPSMNAKLPVDPAIVRGAPPVPQAPAGYEGMPVDALIAFEHGNIFLQEGHLRGFEIRAGTDVIRRLSTSYSIDGPQADPALEESMMGCTLTEDEQKVLHELFGDARDVPPDTAELNAFLFAHGSDYLLILPQGRGMYVRLQDGNASSESFTESTASDAVRSRCARLLSTEFRTYVSSRPLVGADARRILHTHALAAHAVLQRFVRTSQ